MTVPTPTSGPLRVRWAARCRTIADAPAFSIGVLVVIIVNAALLGAETYSGLVTEHRTLLHAAERLCLILFTAEIGVRVGAHLDRPKDFLRDPWNVFDLLVVLVAFMPVIRENTTLLRLLRLARVLRTARFMPQLRILLVAVGRALPGTLSFIFVGSLVIYVYAMVGWVFFSDVDPDHFGSVGRAALTLALLTTMDGFGDAVHAGLQISRFSLLYYASYVLLASFVLVNVLIGVVLTSLDDAREAAREEAEAEAREKREREAPTPEPTPEPASDASDASDASEDAESLRARILAVRDALDLLEAGLPPAAPGSGAALGSAALPRPQTEVAAAGRPAQAGREKTSR
ncbi:ion transporter (plasmid) [Streptomyces sp. BI20]|uniref:ion transporter n=1 Tax=Streptomyces sp. BI20 TaxID=3403460 RepID=UPI003C75140A